MPLPARLASLWRDLFQKARVDSEIDEEVRAYARMLEEEKVGSGMTAEEARRAASIEIGGVVIAAGRDLRGTLDHVRRARIEQREHTIDQRKLGLRRHVRTCCHMPGRFYLQFAH